MMYPVADLSTYNPSYAVISSNSAQHVAPTPGNMPISSLPETAPVVPVGFAPNFVAPSYAPGYMYPYDSSYYYGYAPPQKRAKRAGASQRPSGASTPSKLPQSPGSDSAESSSSNTSSAPPASPAEKPNKPKKFHCEPCEKGFKTQQQYDVHLTTHVACSYEGCKYSAVKGALRMHEMLHVNNMFAKLTTPEEIAKYREERKRRFPTMAKEQDRVAAKEQEKATKLAALEKQRLLRPPSKAPADHHAHEHDDGAAAPTEHSSREDPSPDVDLDEPQRANSRGKRKRPVCKYWKQGKCNKGEQCTFSHANENNNNSNNGERGERTRRGAQPAVAFKPARRNTQAQQQQQQQAPPPPNKPGPKTLLSQFLQSEISKENKIILQCLRFIVNNNFLAPTPPQHGPTPSASLADSEATRNTRSEPLQDDTTTALGSTS